MKHKHSELIKAWADGAEIQYKANGSKDWRDNACPYWDGEGEYRIKPKEKKPVVRWQWVTRMNQDAPQLSRSFFTDEEAKTAFVPGAKIVGKAEWTRMEFDE